MAKTKEILINFSSGNSIAIEIDKKTLDAIFAWINDFEGEEDIYKSFKGKVEYDFETIFFCKNDVESILIKDNE